MLLQRQKIEGLSNRILRFQNRTDLLATTYFFRPRFMTEFRNVRTLLDDSECSLAPTSARISAIHARDSEVERDKMVELQEAPLWHCGVIFWQALPSLDRDHHFMVTCLHLRMASAFFSRVWSFDPRTSARFAYRLFGSGRTILLSTRQSILVSTGPPWKVLFSLTHVKWLATSRRGSIKPNWLSTGKSRSVGNWKVLLPLRAEWT